MNTSKLFVFFLVIFCVFSSKHIIIYNEETLVALNFFLFILFVSHFYGTTISDSLNERANVIKKEVQSVATEMELSFLSLSKDYKKLSKLNFSLKEIQNFILSEFTFLPLFGKKALFGLYLEKFKEKLKTIYYLTLAFQQSLQGLLSTTIFPTLQFLYRKDEEKNSSNMDPELIKSSIYLLSSSS